MTEAGAVDLCVIGAGIHGVGVAQAAAAAGYRVLILEKHEVAFGTSSRSSKLIHGGLRYLESAQFRLVRESLRERAILLRIAPHLVRLVPFHIPVYAATRRSPWQIRAGLSLYAALGGLRAEARFRTLPRKEWEALDGLVATELRAVFRYQDGQTDDAALCRSVLESARRLGAAIEIPATLLSIARNEDGFDLRVGRSSGNEIGVRARCLVNAGGPWIHEIQSLVQGAPKLPSIQWVAGTHIVLERCVERGIYYVEAPQDGRAVFVMPWKGKALVGTTERIAPEGPDRVRATEEEISYLESVHAHYFPNRHAERVESFAGLRVLPSGKGAAFSRPREVQLHGDPWRAPRLVTIQGGKLTGYRLTAEKVMRLLRPSLPRRKRAADTSTLLLPPDPAREPRPIDASTG